VAAQTTQASEGAASGRLIRRRFPQSECASSTRLQADKERHPRRVEMARQADVVIVVGGRSTTTRASFQDLCARLRPACITADTRQTSPEWFDAAKVVD